MSDYKTSRSKSVTWTVPISATVIQPVTISPPGTSSTVCEDAESVSGTISFYLYDNISVSITAGAAVHNSDGTIHLSGCNDYGTYTRIIATCGGTMQDTGAVFDPASQITLCPEAIDSYCHVFTCPMSGTAILTADVEEYFTPVIGDVAGAGTDAADPPGSTQFITRERLKVGGNLTVSVVIGVNSVGISTPITSALVSDDAFYGGVDMTVANGSATWSISPDVDGVALGTDGWSWTDTGGAGSGTGTLLTINNTTASPLHGSTSGIFEPPKQYSLDLRVNSLYDAYPQDLKALVTGKWRQDASPDIPVPVTDLVDVPTGTFAASYTQHNYSAGVTIGTSGGGIYKNEWGPVSVRLQAASLMAAGEDVGLARCLFRTYTWDALTLSQASSLSLMTGSQSVSLAEGVAGSITNTLSTASASVSGTGWQGKDLSGYAYLSLVVNHTSGSAAGYSVKIGGKTWTTDRDGNALMSGSAAVVIDLLAPSNRTQQTEGTDTQWPWGGSPFSCAGDGFAWGVHSAASVLIDGLHGGTGGQTFTLSAMQLNRYNAPQISFLPAYANWLLEYPPSEGDVTTTTKVSRGVQVITDGVQSLEYPRVRWVHIDSSGAPVDEYPDETFASLANLLHTGDTGTLPRRGFDGTALHPNDSSANLRDGFLNADQALVYGYGGGLMYTAAGGWQSGLDHVLGTIPAQFLADSVDVQPAAGDVCGLVTGGTYSGSTALFCAAILRSNIYGLVLDGNTRASASPARHVSLTESGGTAGAAGTADTIAGGEYFHSGVRGTGLAYMKGGHGYDAKAELGSLPYPHLGVTGLSRYRKRLSFALVALMGKGVSCDVSAAGRQARAYAGSSGHLMVGMGEGVIPSSWSDTDTGIAEQWPWIRWEKRQRQPRLILLSVTSDHSLKLRYSLDEGASWSMASLDANGTCGAEVETDHGLKYVYYRGTDGKIRGQILDAQFNVIKSEFVCQDGSGDIAGVDDAGISADHFTIGGGVWYIGLFYFVSGTLTYKTARDGMNFS